MILPVWHEVTKKEVLDFSPILADKKAALTQYGLTCVADDILKVIAINRYKYELNKDENIKINWGVFNQERMFENLVLLEENNDPVWLIRSTQKESVGINLFNLPSRGFIYFEYFIEQMNMDNPNIVFYMIPIKKGDRLIEVGFNIADDERSQFSPHRHPRRPPKKLNEWIAEKIEFNFEDLEDLDYVVFAPRINEGCFSPDNGQFKIRNVIAESE